MITSLGITGWRKYPGRQAVILVVLTRVKLEIGRCSLKGKYPDKSQGKLPSHKTHWAEHHPQGTDSCLAL